MQLACVCEQVVPIRNPLLVKSMLSALMTETYLEPCEQLFLRCKRASCWADCPSACTCSWQQAAGWPFSPASVWLCPSCPAERSQSPARATSKRVYTIESQMMCCRKKNASELHLPHPNSHDAQPGSHFAARLGLSHPHQPCVISPSPVGGEAGNPLWKQRHSEWFCLPASLIQVYKIYITETKLQLIF